MKADRDFNAFLDITVPLLRNSLPLIPALEAAAKVHNATALFLLNRIRKGGSFSSAASELPLKGSVFKTFLPMLSGAEETGNIRGVLEEMKKASDEEKKRKERLLSMMLYPLFIAAVSFIGTALLVFRGIPAFSSALSLSKEAADAIVFNSIKSLVLLVVLSLIFLAVLYRVFGTESVFYRIFFLLSLMLSSSVPLGNALGSCITAAGGKKEQKALLCVKESIEDGKGMADSFEASLFFPPLCVSWIKTAEAGGNAASAFRDIALYYREKDGVFKERVEKLSEPVSILIIAVYLLTLVQGSVLPLITNFGGVL